MAKYIIMKYNRCLDDDTSDKYGILKDGVGIGEPLTSKTKAVREIQEIELPNIIYVQDITFIDC